MGAARRAVCRAGRARRHPGDRRRAPRWIRPGGWLVLEIGADQGAAVTELLSRAGYEAVEIRPDLAGRDRAAVARAR